MAMHLHFPLLILQVLLLTSAKQNTCAHVSVCACVCVYVCMCVCVRVHAHVCVHVCMCYPLTPGLEEAQCVSVALPLDVPQLRHARREEALLDPPPVVHIELQLHVGNMEEVLHVVVVVFFGTDVKVSRERGHGDDIINVLSVRDVVRKASIHNSL